MMLSICRSIAVAGGGSSGNDSACGSASRCHLASAATSAATAAFAFDSLGASGPPSAIRVCKEAAASAGGGAATDGKAADAAEEEEGGAILSCVEPFPPPGDAWLPFRDARLAPCPICRVHRSKHTAALQRCGPSTQIDSQGRKVPTRMHTCLRICSAQFSACLCVCRKTQCVCVRVRV